jgi:hypothetical protein
VQTGHARELARVQAKAASAQAEAASAQTAAAAMRGELLSRDTEIAELKRARIHVGATDVDADADADGGGGAGAGASGASTSDGGGSASSGLAQLHASHQALRQVKQEKADVGEQLADKDELRGRC